MAIERKVDQLTERELRGYALWKQGQRSNTSVIVFNETSTFYVSSKGQSFYPVARLERNRRGTLAIEYRCGCGDFRKYGRVDCMHIFAERLRRYEVVVIGELSEEQRTRAKASRRPARKRVAADGRSMRTVQRRARVKMPVRVRDLLRQAVKAYVVGHPDVLLFSAGGSATPAIYRAAALVHKISMGASADEMVSEYASLINNGDLRLRKPPHQNTLSRWMNDPKLTDTLRWLLRETAKPFRACESAAIVDTTKLSQMRTAHSRWIEYGDDTRDGADWMKAHALVGAETMVVMGVEFTGSRGKGTHDSHFILSLVRAALETFPLVYVLGDKAYLAEAVLGELWKLGIKAVIPVKKGWDHLTKSLYYEACEHLAQWFDQRQAEFHELYRLRVKVESFFSHLKRVSDGYCWSRGRVNKEVPNAESPCTAWVNEALCKFIYVNLRTTVRTEEETGYTIDYLCPSRFFPAIPEDKRLIG